MKLIFQVAAVIFYLGLCRGNPILQNKSGNPDSAGSINRIGKTNTNIKQPFINRSELRKSTVETNGRDSVENTNDKDVLKVFDYLQANKDLYKIQDAYKDFRLTSLNRDRLTDNTYIILTQYVNRVPVRGAGFNFTLDNQGTIIDKINRIDTGAFNVNTTPVVDEATAKKIVLNDSRPFNTTPDNSIFAQLIIAHINGGIHLVWIVNIRKGKPPTFDLDYYIDAHSGEILDKVSNIVY